MIFPQRMNCGVIESYEYISDGNYTHAGAIIFRNIFTKEKVEFLKTINVFDDNVITIYAIQFGNLFYINRPIYMYRQLNDSLWNSFSQLEQSILNAMDYNIICKHAPMFDIALAKRQYCAMRSVYQNKRDIRELLGTKYNRYLSISEKNSDDLVSGLLLWEYLSIRKKFCVYVQWIKYKIKAYL